MNICFKGKFKVTSGYRLPERSDHHGIDLVGLSDKTVYAPCDGIIGSSTIVYTGKTAEWGNYVRLDTSDGKYSIFLCHLATRYVAKGQRVKKGDKLGVMGCTGYCVPAGVKGTHTHFEVRKKGTSVSVNPADFIGVPNKVGTYEANTENTLSENLAILQKHGVINTPSYWLSKAPNVQYLEQLIANMAEVLEK